MTLFDPPAKPIGIIESVAGGFEAVSGRPWIIILPILLDAFLWLGPRLSIAPLVDAMVASIVQQPTLVDEAVQQAQLDTLAQFGAQLNIFGFLSTAPLGLPSLMVDKLPLATPLGEALVWSLNSWMVLFVLFLIFSLIGLLLGTLYLSGIARQMAPGSHSAEAYLGQLAIGWLRLVIFAIMLFVAGIILSIPYSLIIVLLSSINWILGGVASILGVMVLLWAFFYFSFVPHGIILGGRSLLNSIWDSLRLVQWNLTSTMGLFALVFALNLGLNYVWTLPDEQSWLMLVGIAGHAYIATSLITATFLFYRDRHRWWQESRQWLRNQLAERQRRVEFIVRTRGDKDDDHHDNN